MTLETAVASEAVQAAQTVANVVESGIRKAWSILDAASEKKLPSEVLGQNAIQAIQGNVSPGG